MKNILFLVTGMTPQIITETVWALACDPDREEKWIPDEIQVLSTTTGLKKIKDNLFGENGIFNKMCEEYNLPAIKFDENSLNAILDKDGNKLDDLKTPEENEMAADMICQKIREFTQNDEVSLHVSIAGGRKTMGFYAGYALSLYGRIQDRLSHVLVSEKYETLQGFYYPAIKKGQSESIIKKTHKKIEQNHEVYEEELLDTFDAKVWLANIPFVRLRSSLNDKDIVINQNFSTVVKKLNLSLEPSIILDANDKTITIGDMECKLSPKEFSLYLLVAKLKKKGETLYYPSKYDQNMTIDDEHQKLYNELYKQHKGDTSKYQRVNEEYLRIGLSNLKKKLIQAFGTTVFEKICIKKVGDGNRRSIDLDNSQIHIIEIDKDISC